MIIKINKRIEIVSSTETELSSMSQVSRAAILTVLTKHYTRVGITVVNNLSDLEALVARKPDLVFLGMKFILSNPQLGSRDSNKIWLSEYLDYRGISYTGSSQPSHELELNKHLAKQRVLDSGFKTSPFYVAQQNQQINARDIHLAFPVFIKPTNRGGGSGIDSDSVAHNFEQLMSKVRSITDNHKSDSLIERYLPGREFSVALLKHEHSAEFSAMPIEKIAPKDKHGDRILSGKVKSADSVRDEEVSDKILRSKITKLAMDVFYVLGARDYGRIDIRLDQFGTPQFLEANLLPSLIKGYGSFPKACMMNLNLDHEPMILRIVELGLARSSDDLEELLELNHTEGISIPVLDPVFAGLNP